jgi:hypothetical protein
VQWVGGCFWREWRSYIIWSFIQCTLLYVKVNEGNQCGYSKKNAWGHEISKGTIKYWKTSVHNTVFFSVTFYCEKCTIKSSTRDTVLSTEVFQYLIDTRATGCITQLLRSKGTLERWRHGWKENDNGWNRSQKMKCEEDLCMLIHFVFSKKKQ